MNLSNKTTEELLRLRKEGEPMHEWVLCRERYDHDEGAWNEGSEDIRVRLIDEETMIAMEEERDALRQRVQELENEKRAAIDQVRAQLEAVTKERDALKADIAAKDEALVRAVIPIRALLIVEEKHPVLCQDLADAFREAVTTIDAALTPNCGSERAGQEGKDL